MPLSLLLSRTHKTYASESKNFKQKHTKIMKSYTYDLNNKIYNQNEFWLRK